ncbi:hypothetical protein [Bacillus sp. B15-48]|uniref:hypothetical protein n=1 Tax=Bacillus sp. B15-48 TaxID=1548601 RepID=UPI00193F0F9B|nr:hypothetical protein [Bacillus sp. B15-48]MBM4762711.1 hypothetical protein [Bacillus sp. B15-48]
MPYLTYEEYYDLGFTQIEDLNEFDQLLKRASDAVDSVTRYFYRYNDIEKDVSFRRDQFKRAVAAQIEYFYEMGATSTHGMNEPSTVQIGRTQMSAGSRNSQTAPQNNLVSKDVYFYLKDTGLLYTGLGVRS